MKICKLFISVLILLPLLSTSGCQLNPKKQVLATTESQVKTRSIQTRSFDSNNKNKVMRSVISTLQDLDFLIDNADLVHQSVSGVWGAPINFNGNDPVGLFKDGVFLNKRFIKRLVLLPLPAFFLIWVSNFLETHIRI